MFAKPGNAAGAELGRPLGIHIAGGGVWPDEVFATSLDPFGVPPCRGGGVLVGRAP